MIAMIQTVSLANEYSLYVVNTMFTNTAMIQYIYKGIVITTGYSLTGDFQISTD